MRRHLPEAVLLAFAVTACTGGANPPPSRSQTPIALPSPEALNATRTEHLPTDRYELPEFSAAGFQALLRELRGTPVVVNFWASWCEPCLEEGPHLAAAAREFGDRVQFLGVDIMDDRASAQFFIRQFNWPYPSVFDPLGAIQSSFGFLGQPVTVFYDRDGETVSLIEDGFEVDQWSGAIPRRTLFEVVEDLANS